MKKADVINLIRCHYEKNEPAFRHQSMEIAQEFDGEGDESLADYIVSLVNDSNSFVPQSLGGGSEFLVPLRSSENKMPKHILRLPDSITENIGNIVRATNHTLGVNKFLFYGEPGTGKTEAVKLIARETQRELYYVAMTQIVDSYLGQTAKNIELVFREINDARHPEKVIVLFDEIDALALTRIDANDVREMGRATTAMLRGLDSLNSGTLLFATTNLYQALDKALLRRFDLTVSFDEYERGDLESVAVSLLEEYVLAYPFIKSDKPLFKKILKLYSALPSPGDLENMIKVAIAFSKPDEQYDYLRRLYRSATGSDPEDMLKLKTEGFTVREIEKLTSISKSTVSRRINERSCKGSGVSR